MASSDNKRVAKNAIALTLRMLLVTIVGLYISRIVLEALGVDDYGIYGVIGGVVGMVSFLNSSMAGATSRFITFELGRGDHVKLRTIFSSALLIHIAIALVVAVLAETVGLWFVNNCMNFPPDRMHAVNVLYQFTILSMFVSFTQVPYSAAIIAHERMSIYAYFEILNVIIKLLVVYLLFVISSDRLIFYAGATLGVSISMALVYRYYCIRHFAESKFKFVWDKKIIREMLIFSGYDLYGNMCVIFRNQGQPIILNMFFGVLANAGASIASTVTGAIDGLTASVEKAFKPQIIKLYANNSIYDMANAMRRSVQFTLLAYAMFSIPVFIEVERIIYLWLGQVPQYSVEFLRLIIIVSFFNIVIATNNTAIHATGNIKNISFYNGTLCMLCPVLSFVILKFWIKDANIIYIVNIVITGIITILSWCFIKKQISHFEIRKYITYICKSGIAIILSFVVLIFLKINFFPIVKSENYIQSIMLIVSEGILNTLILLTFSIIIAFNRVEVDYLRNMFFKFIKRAVKC